MLPSSRSPTFSALSDSALYRDYQDAFEKSTGISLYLHQPGEDHGCGVALQQPGCTVSPFCILMGSSNRACKTCFALQKELEEKAQFQPKTLQCFGGLCETAVPVRVGGELIAFLQIGRNLLESPSQRQFAKITRELLRIGIHVDLKRAEEIYFALRVITPLQYQAVVKLLSIFALHLAACGDQLSLDRCSGENLAVAQGRKIIDSGFRDELSIGQVARQVNVSAGYFSLLFKEETGINFVEYVARLRVEKAKNLLHNPTFRISEVAFEVGFQSLSQFNRSFQRFAGSPPRVYRASHTGTTMIAT